MGWAVFVLAFVLALVLLLVIVVFGAIFALAYRHRRADFSYFASGMTTPKVKDEDESGFSSALKVKARPFAHCPATKKGGPRAALSLTSIHRDHWA